MGEELRETLEAAERRFRRVIEKNADGIIIVDPDGHVLFANPAAEELFGRSRPELEEHSLGFPLVAGETTEVDVVLPDRRTIATEMRVVETEWSGKSAYLASLRDVTDRNRLEQERRKHLEERIARVEAEAMNRRLRLVNEVGALLASSFDGSAGIEPFAQLVVGRFANWCIVTVRAEMNASDASTRFATAHQDAASRQDLEESSAAHFHPDSHDFPGLGTVWKKCDLVLLRENDLADAPAELAPLSSVIHVPLVAEGATFGTVTFALTGDATPDLLSGSVFLPADQILAQEMARHLALHLENARLYRAAEDANRLRDEFLATISHELRTPLQAILGWTEILRRSELSDEKVLRAAEIIERNAHAQQHLVDDMLDVSRIITGRLRLEMDRIDVADPVRAAAESVEPTVDTKGVKLQASFPDEALHVRADPNRLQQIVWNLLANSIKFTPQDGTIEVTVRRNHGHAEIRVRDDGQGIDPQLMPHIFRRFRRGGGFSGQGSAAGLGLGLSIVQHLVEMHGGRIWAESEGLGQGATFLVHLPLLSTNESSGGDAS